MIAVASAVLAAATMPAAEAAKHRRAAPAVEEQGVVPGPDYAARPSGPCRQDEGQGRFTPCDGGGDAN
jgi:hypothetical protein